jgi:hypothetical protein
LGIFGDFVGPRPSFEEILVRVDHFLDFDAVVKEGAPIRAEITYLIFFVGFVDLARGF